MAIRLSGRVAGQGVRWNPGQSEALSSARLKQQQHLAQVLSPDLDWMTKLSATVDKPSTDDIQAGIQILLGKNRQTTGGDEAAKWLQQRGGRIGHPVEVGDSKGYLAQYEASGIHIPTFMRNPGDAGVYIDPALQGMESVRTIAHELGHAVAMPNKRVVDPLSAKRQHKVEDFPVLKEVEAEAIAQGVLNRLYPHTGRNTGREESGFFIRHTVPTDYFGGYPQAAPNATTHLNNQSAAINAAVEQIVPNPRQPFRQVLPEVHQIRQQNQLADQAYDAAMEERLARYGY